NPDFEQATKDLGRSFEILRNTYKPYPCGVVIHPVIEGCIRLATANPLDPARIERVRLTCNPLVTELTGKKTPSTKLEAKLSVYHSAAVALMKRRVADPEYDETLVRDPAVIALRDRVEVATDAAIREDETDVEVHLAGGRQLRVHIDHVIGS